MVGEAEGRLEVVGREQDGLALVVREALQQAQRADFAGKVEEGRRLVEEKKPVRCTQRP